MTHTWGLRVVLRGVALLQGMVTMVTGGGLEVTA